MGRVARGRRWTCRGGTRLSDILDGQPADPARLAEIYDLEHDAIGEDLVFYREMSRRAPGATVDLGCGSGRLFASMLAGGASRIVGVDGSAALLDRARQRIERDPALTRARDAGLIELVHVDVRSVRRPDRFGLAVLAGVLPHLDGPEDAVRALGAARRLLARDGMLVIDTIGPGGLPREDLPLSVDWEREDGVRRIVRRSQIERREAPEGLRVRYVTMTDLVGRDGTIARLPAEFRLWYPSPRALVGLAASADLIVEAAYGSHDLDPPGDGSERCILMLRPDPGS